MNHFCIRSVWMIELNIFVFWFNFRQLYRQLFLFLVGSLVLILGLSRCYIAAHFPHQVILGLFAGNLFMFIYFNISKQMCYFVYVNLNILCMCLLYRFILKQILYFWFIYCIMLFIVIWGLQNNLITLALYFCNLHF